MIICISIAKINIQKIGFPPLLFFIFVIHWEVASTKDWKGNTNFAQPIVYGPMRTSSVIRGFHDLGFWRWLALKLLKGRRRRKLHSSSSGNTSAGPTSSICLLDNWPVSFRASPHPHPLISCTNFMFAIRIRNYNKIETWRHDGAHKNNTEEVCICLYKTYTGTMYDDRFVLSASEDLWDDGRWSAAAAEAVAEASPSPSGDNGRVTVVLLAGIMISSVVGCGGGSKKTTGHLFRVIMKLKFLISQCLLFILLKFPRRKSLLQLQLVKQSVSQSVHQLGIAVIKIHHGPSSFFLWAECGWFIVWLVQSFTHLLSHPLQ